MSDDAKDHIRAGHARPQGHAHADHRRRPRRSHGRLPAGQAGSARDRVRGGGPGRRDRQDRGPRRPRWQVPLRPRRASLLHEGEGGRRPLARDHARGVPQAPAHVAHLLEQEVPRLPAARPGRDQEARARSSSRARSSPICGRRSSPRAARTPSSSGSPTASASVCSTSSSAPTPRRCGASRPPRSARSGRPSGSRACRSSARRRPPSSATRATSRRSSASSTTRASAPARCGSR